MHGASDERGETVVMRRWLPQALTRPVLVVTVMALAAGYGQFGAVAALGDVAKSFGHVVTSNNVIAQAGLSGAVLGLGLAVLRLASLGGLPLAALGDRLGRKKTLIAWTIIGLALTILAAVSPSYWWFVAIFALGRPFLSATAALSQVVVAELSKPSGRAMALAFVTAGYGLGAGINALTHSALRGVIGFRGLFLTTAIPLLVVMVIAKLFPEPARFDDEGALKPRFGSVGSNGLTRLLKVMVVLISVSAVSAPSSSFVYLYAENVVHLPKTIESGMVIAAALTGVIGLVVGRRAADHWGRRPAIAIGISGIAVAALLLYAGSKPSLVAGFLAGVLSLGFVAPGGTAFTNELFHTDVRASVAGWGIVASVIGGVIGLIGFGVVADQTGSFEIAALVTFVPVIPALIVLRLLPESLGVELEGTLGAEADNIGAAS
jgi:MFS family permease